MESEAVVGLTMNGTIKAQEAVSKSAATSEDQKRKKGWFGALFGGK